MRKNILFPRGNWLHKHALNVIFFSAVEMFRISCENFSARKSAKWAKFSVISWRSVSYGEGKLESFSTRGKIMRYQFSCTYTDMGICKNRSHWLLWVLSSRVSKKLDFIEWLQDLFFFFFYWGVEVSLYWKFHRHELAVQMIYVWKPGAALLSLWSEIFTYCKTTNG